MGSNIQTLRDTLLTTANRERFLYLVDAVVSAKEADKELAKSELTAYLIANKLELGDLSDTGLVNIKDSLLKATTAKLVFANMPSNELIVNLYKLITSLSDCMLLDIQVNSDIKGGFVLYISGKVVDLSFKHKVEKLFQQDAFKQKVLLLLQ